MQDGLNPGKAQQFQSDKEFFPYSDKHMDTNKDLNSFLPK